MNSSAGSETHEKRMLVRNLNRSAVFDVPPQRLANDTQLETERNRAKCRDSTMIRCSICLIQKQRIPGLRPCLNAAAIFRLTLIIPSPKGFGWRCF